jgi:outer membrane lipoprotein-sorting protein
MKFLYFILFSTLLVSSSIAQVEDRRTREEQQRISERERRIKQIKAVFNQFNQDLPFLPVESGRVGIRSIELKNDKLQSWEV